MMSCSSRQVFNSNLPSRGNSVNQSPASVLPPAGDQPSKLDDSRMNLVDSLNIGKEIILSQGDFFENGKNSLSVSDSGKTLSDASMDSGNLSDSEWKREYQVQVLTTEDAKEAEQKKKELEQIFGIGVLIVYNQPYFKLRTGNFTDTESAGELKRRLLEMGYEGVWIVETKVLVKKKSLLAP